MTEEQVEEAKIAVMPAIIFASPLKCSDIKATNKSLKGFDDKNILDNILYHQFKHTG
jgi:hypothetical protein